MDVRNTAYETVFPNRSFINKNQKKNYASEIYF